MKKTWFCIIMVIVALIGMGFTSLYLLATHTTEKEINTYTIFAAVDEIGNGEIVVSLPDGNLFGFYCDDCGYNKGDSVAVVFDDMGTPENIYDDEIVAVKG